MIKSVSELVRIRTSRSDSPQGGKARALYRLLFDSLWFWFDVGNVQLIKWHTFLWFYRFDDLVVSRQSVAGYGRLYVSQRAEFFNWEKVKYVVFKTVSRDLKKRFVKEARWVVLFVIWKYQPLAFFSKTNVKYNVFIIWFGDNCLY